ncbi:type VI secretion system Vgr family protein, partial [Hydromonas duriensis]
MIPNFNARTISVQSPVFKSSDWGTPYILFHSLKGSENINELFEYVVQVRAQDEEGQGIVERYISKAESLAGGAPGSNLDLKSTIGSNLTISIELDGKRLGVWGESIERQAGGILDSARGAGVRHINGIITKAAHLGSLGRYPLYEFTIRNWMWLLTQSSDYKVWQKVSIPDIIRAVLSTLPYKVDYRLTKTYPSMDYIVQYSESHYHFIKRLMESVGISFFVDHQKDGHTVVITDALSGFKPMDSVAYQECHVHPAGLKLAEEYISRLEPLQQHVTGQIRLNDHQFKQPKADQTSTSSQPWETAHNALEHYEWQQGGYLSADEGGKDKAQVYMEAIRQHGHRAIAAGNLRGIQSGHSLFIRNSTHEDANRGWIVLGTTLHATETSQETHSDSKYSIHVEFTLHPDNEQVRPDRR